MLTIAICDDMQNHIDEAKDKLAHVSINQSFHVLEYTSSAMLLKDIETDPTKIKILILDIEIGETSGIALATQIQNLNPFIEIIFISSYQKYFQDVYLVSHHAFILKPINIGYLENALNKACLRISQNTDQSLFFTSKGKNLVLNQNDILYFEREQRKTLIQTKNETHTIYDSIKKLVAKIDSPLFIRCHESYIVNFLYIKSYKFDQILLTDNRMIPISRKYKTDISNTFNMVAAGESLC